MAHLRDKTRLVLRSFLLPLRLALDLPSDVVAGLLLALPSSVWAQLSRNAPTSRPWDLAIRVFTEYDDNVPLAGENASFAGDKGSVRFGTSVSGGYRLIQTKKRQAGLGATLFRRGTGCIPR